MTLRIDKYTWAVRLTKTRSQASELISKGKIKVNEVDVKPSRDVKLGDIIQVHKNSAVFSYKVLELLEKRVGPKLVSIYIEDITPIEEVEKYKTYQEAQRVYRDMGTGRPSKKDRRSLDDFLDF
ncbi:MAG: RNA-binding S4 domain-containing protein [Crocinitomicaceae bacterium]|jgi:ribosome-associated heat shock protein Hsp15